MKRLILKNISKAYAGKTVLKDVTLEVVSPKIVVIYGPNGSGKTTLIKIIAGLIPPTNGRVEIYDGRDTLVGERRRIIGYASHYPLIYEELTVRENLEFYGRLYGIKNPLDDDNVKMIIEILELRQVLRHVTGNLSYGWKKRADIARALIHNPDIVLFDEPFTGLDERGRKSLIELQVHLMRNDKIAVITTPTGEHHGGLEQLGNFVIKKEISDGALK